jgi:uncharacterized protein YfeS
MRFMKRKKERMKFGMMVKNTYNTFDSEFTCDDCYEYMEEFAEYTLFGGPQRNGHLTRVQDHLEKCMDCDEIYKTLIEALKKGVEP